MASMLDRIRSFGELAEMLSIAFGHMEKESGKNCFAAIVNQNLAYLKLTLLIFLRVKFNPQ
jgi:hypothetical protein